MIGGGWRFTVIGEWPHSLASILLKNPKKICAYHPLYRANATSNSFCFIVNCKLLGNLFCRWKAKEKSYIEVKEGFGSSNCLRGIATLFAQLLLVSFQLVMLSSVICTPLVAFFMPLASILKKTQHSVRREMWFVPLSTLTSLLLPKCADKNDTFLSRIRCRTIFDDCVGLLRVPAGKSTTGRGFAFLGFESLLMSIVYLYYKCHHSNVKIFSNLTLDSFLFFCGGAFLGVS